MRGSEGPCSDGPGVTGRMNTSRMLTNCSITPPLACPPMGNEGIKIDSDFNSEKVICDADGNGTTRQETWAPGPSGIERTEINLGQLLDG